MESGRNAIPITRSKPIAQGVIAAFYEVQSKSPAECGVFYELIKGEIGGALTTPASKMSRL